MPLSKTRGSTGKKCPFSPRPQRGRKGSEPQLLSREHPLTPAHGPFAEKQLRLNHSSMQFPFALASEGGEPPRAVAPGSIGADKS